MKVKLLMLAGMAVVPLLSIGQTSKPCLFNKGKMSIVGTSSANTILYVDGDFIASRDAADANVKSDIYVESSKTVITGNFIEDMRYVDGNNSNVFTFPGVNTTGYDAKASVISFRGTAPQRIMTRWGYDSHRKGANYINFPTIEVDNVKHVKIDPRIAASAQVVDLKTGKLILDATRLAAGDTIYNDYKNPNSSTVVAAGDVAPGNSSIMAHLYVRPGSQNGKINYNWNKTATDLNQIGTIQVHVAMDTITDYNADPNVQAGRSIVGMGSPFKQLGADYFMWNYIMFPWGDNIIGRLNYVETEPRTMIRAGKGFIVSIDPKGATESDYTAVTPWNGPTKFAERAQNRYVFDRVAYNSNNNLYPLDKHTKQPADGTTGYKKILLSQLGTNDETASFNVDDFAWERSTASLKPRTMNPYTDETLNIDNVGAGSDLQQKLTLMAGYNYLANPFTTPLDLTDLVTGMTNTGGWGVSSGDGATGYDIYNYVWMLNPSSVASAKYNLDNNAALGKDRIYVKYSYDLMAAVGSTYNGSDRYVSDGSGSSTTIAPLQMFVVYANNTGAGKNIIIPEKNRQISSGSLFLRSASATRQPAEDDFLFQVTDKKTKAYDRTAVVVRTPEEITKNNYNSIKKLITTVTSSDDKTKSAAEYKSVTEAGEVSGNSVSSLIYTKDQEGKALLSNFLSAKQGITEKTTTLYLTPSMAAQDISISAMRWNTSKRVQKIMLKDNKLNKEVELSSVGEYITTTSPSDNTDRFTLRFIMGTSGIEDEVADNNGSIYSYYKDNLLTVAGFEDADLGSLISIYDVQGRLLKQDKVTELTKAMTVSFAPGAYIVKVVGNRSYVSKFLVK